MSEVCSRSLTSLGSGAPRIQLLHRPCRKQHPGWPIPGFGHCWLNELNIVFLCFGEQPPWSTKQRVCMKHKWMLVFVVSLLWACGTSHREDNATEDADAYAEGSVVYKPADAIWAYDYNQEMQDFEVRQLRPVDQDTLTGKAVEEIINATWPDVQVLFLGASGDTAFVSIPDSQVLTRQMGTAGAQSFMISATYSFTELKGITHVSFDFAEGDHAIPGVYSRKAWQEYINQ